MGIFDSNIKLKSSNSNMFLKNEAKRKSINQSLKTEILQDQKAKCANCPVKFFEDGVRPHFHHKNMNPKDNRKSNIIAVCPTCHDKIHQKLKKKIVKKVDSLGFVCGTTTRIVGKTPKKKKSKTKTKKRMSKNNFNGGLFNNSPKLKFKW